MTNMPIVQLPIPIPYVTSPARDMCLWHRRTKYEISGTRLHYIQDSIVVSQLNLESKFSFVIHTSKIAIGAAYALLSLPCQTRAWEAIFKAHVTPLASHTAEWYQHLKHGVHCSMAIACTLTKIFHVDIISTMDHECSKELVHELRQSTSKGTCVDHLHTLDCWVHNNPTYNCMPIRIGCWHNHDRKSQTQGLLDHHGRSMCLSMHVLEWAMQT